MPVRKLAKKATSVKPKPKPVVKKAVKKPVRSNPVKGNTTRLRSNDARQVDAKAYAFQMRVNGHPYRGIAQDMRDNGIADVSHVTVKNWIDAECEARLEEVGPKLRAMEIARLERYLRSLYTRIELGDDKAIAVAIRVSESYRKLLGMDAPQVIEQHVKSEQVQPAILLKLEAARLQQEA